MQIITLLNQCYRFPGFVYQHVRFTQGRRSLQVRIRPRAGSPAICSGCHRQAPGYDHFGSAVRVHSYRGIWGTWSFLYRMHRVDCKACGVIVEAVPWADGKHQLTKAYMLFLARWARKLSGKETAQSFRTSWDQVCHAVEYVVEWALQHRTLAPISAIGVDEIQFAEGHKYGVVLSGQPLAAEHNVACRKNPIPFW